MSESQSRRLARAFQVLESASKASVPGVHETETRRRAPEEQADEPHWTPDDAGLGRARGTRRSTGEERASRADRAEGERSADRSEKASAKGDDAEKVSPTALEQAALAYLNRYDASVEQLRRVLMRRVARHSSGAVRDRAEADVRRLLERFQGSRLLDDARYAEALARGLRARGASRLGIVQKMRARGVSEEHSTAAIAKVSVDHEGCDPELVAARAYARKRRLTSRFDMTKPEERRKALAALARKGFSFSIAGRALIVSDEE